MSVYLVYVVVGLALLYLILEFTGFLEEYGESQARKQAGQTGRKKVGLNKEVERRLKVFEDYLKDADESPDDNS